MGNTQPTYRQPLLEAYLTNGFKEMVLSLPKLPKYTFYKYNFGALLPKDKNIKILELGPGIGEFMQFLKNEGYSNIKGVDGSNEVVRHCQSLGLNVSCCAEISSFFNDPTERNYDLVVANDILEHFSKEELWKLLGSVKKSLKQGGCLVGRVPNASSCFLGSHTRYLDFTHELSFTEHSLKQILCAWGFTQVGVYAPNYFCYYLNPLNYIGIAGTSILNLIQLVIHRINGHFDTRLFSSNIIFSAKNEKDTNFKL